MDEEVTPRGVTNNDLSLLWRTCHAWGSDSERDSVGSRLLVVAEGLLHHRMKSGREENRCLVRGHYISRTQSSQQQSRFFPLSGPARIPLMQPVMVSAYLFCAFAMLFISIICQHVSLWDIISLHHYSPSVQRLPPRELDVAGANASSSSEISSSDYDVC